MPSTCLSRASAEMLSPHVFISLGGEEALLSKQKTISHGLIDSILLPRFSRLLREFYRRILKRLERHGTLWRESRAEIEARAGRDMSPPTSIASVMQMSSDARTTFTLHSR